MANLSPAVMGTIAAVAAVFILVMVVWRRRPSVPPETIVEELPPGLKLPIGTLNVGPFRIQQLVSETQVAVTYKARNTTNDEIVFLKLPSRLCLADHDNLKRFGREGQIFDSLSHPNVIRKVDTGTIDDGGKRVPYLVLQYTEGQHLDDLLAETGALPVEDAVRLLAQVASALEAIHSHGIVHRNLSPEAIRVTPDGRVIVYNFGVARAITMETITLHGQIVGTVEYIAPEQIYGRQVDARADLYALGVVAYRVLTGKSPFVVTSIAGLVKQKNEMVDGAHARQAVPTIPEPLDRIVSQLMNQDPARRPASATDVLKAFEAIEAAGPA